MASPSSNVKYVAVCVALAGLGTASTKRVVSPVDGYIRYMAYASDVAVDANNALTTSIAGTAITGGAFALTTANTVAGMVVAAVPTAANRVLRGQAIGCATDGGGGAGDGCLTILIEQD